MIATKLRRLVGRSRFRYFSTEEADRKAIKRHMSEGNECTIGLMDHSLAYCARWWYNNGNATRGGLFYVIPKNLFSMSVIAFQMMVLSFVTAMCIKLVDYLPRAVALACTGLLAGSAILVGLLLHANGAIADIS
jgi:hypothetical protein